MYSVGWKQFEILSTRVCLSFCFVVKMTFLKSFSITWFELHSQTFHLSLSLSLSFFFNCHLVAWCLNEAKNIYIKMMEWYIYIYNFKGSSELNKKNAMSSIHQSVLFTSCILFHYQIFIASTPRSMWRNAIKTSSIIPLRKRKRTRCSCKSLPSH